MASLSLVSCFTSWSNSSLCRTMDYREALTITTGIKPAAADISVIWLMSRKALIQLTKRADYGSTNLGLVDAWQILANLGQLRPLHRPEKGVEYHDKLPMSSTVLEVQKGSTGNFMI